MPDERAPGPGRWRRPRKQAQAGIHWHRTLLNKGPGPLQPGHLVYRPRRGGAGMLYCLVLDCSASMLRQDKLAMAKGLISAWAHQLYTQRSALAVVGFSGQGACILRPPSRAPLCSDAWVAPIPGGGGSPVGAGIQRAQDLMAQAKRRHPDQPIGLWLLTDGRTTQQPPRPDIADFCEVVDFETEAIRLGGAQRIARAWQAPCWPVSAFIEMG
nr:VWA domain-containing protein [Ectothiorhodospira variabilis]